MHFQQYGRLPKAVHVRNQKNLAIDLVKVANGLHGWDRVACAEEVIEILAAIKCKPKDIGITEQELNRLSLRGWYRPIRALLGKRPKNEKDL